MGWATADTTRNDSTKESASDVVIVSMIMIVSQSLGVRESEHVIAILIVLERDAKDFVLIESWAAAVSTFTPTQSTSLIVKGVNCIGAAGFEKVRMT